MMNTDKTLILALVMACAALPVLAADAPEAAAPTSIAGPAAAETPAAGKPAASKTKRKKAKATKAAATENKVSEPQPTNAPVADAASAAATVPAAEAAPVAAPQPRRVRVKDRASALAAVAAAQAAEAAPENAVAPAAAAPASASSAVAQAAGKADVPADQKSGKQEAVKQEAVKDQVTAKPLAVPEPALLVAEPLPLATEPLPVAAEPPPVAECNPPFKSEVAALFDRWNASLRSGDPKKVVANYAPGSVLLPTVSNRARFTAAEKEEYFAHFLQRRPEGRIDDRVIEVDCNSATDSGMYTFRFSDGTQVRARYTFAYKRVDGEWLISSHHSSAMPEKAENGPEHKSTKAAAMPVENPKGWVRFP